MEVNRNDVANAGVVTRVIVTGNEVRHEVQIGENVYFTTYNGVLSLIDGVKWGTHVDGKRRVVGLSTWCSEHNVDAKSIGLIQLRRQEVADAWKNAGGVVPTKQSNKVTVDLAKAEAEALMAYEAENVA